MLKKVPRKYPTVEVDCSKLMNESVVVLCCVVLCSWQEESQLSSSWDPQNEFLSRPNRHIRLPPEGFYEEVCGCVSTEEILVPGFICKLPKCFLSQRQGPATQLTF